MKTRLIASITALFLMFSLTSCGLIAAPFRLIGRTLRSVGGVGGAARLAPLLLDAKDQQNKPVRGLKTDLKPDTAPSQKLEKDQRMASR